MVICKNLLQLRHHGIVVGRHRGMVSQSGQLLHILERVYRTKGNKPNEYEGKLNILLNLEYSGFIWLHLAHRHPTAAQQTPQHGHATLNFRYYRYSLTAT